MLSLLNKNSGGLLNEFIEKTRFFRKNQGVLKLSDGTVYAIFNAQDERESDTKYKTACDCTMYIRVAQKKIYFFLDSRCDSVNSRPKTRMY